MKTLLIQAFRAQNKNANLNTYCIKISVLMWCGKQDLKSETAVNHVPFCIIRDNNRIKSDKFNQYHTL